MDYEVRKRLARKIRRNSKVYRKLLTVDFTAVEERLLSFDTETDIHKRAASEYLNVPYDQVTDEQRRVGKALNFGRMYDMRPERLKELLLEMTRSPREKENTSGQHGSHDDTFEGTTGRSVSRPAHQRLRSRKTGC